MRDSIITAIYNKLDDINEIKEVFKYNKGHFTKFPVAVILGSENEKTRESTATILKTYKFKIQILQQVNEAVLGQEDSEDLLVSLADILDNVFDLDDTLGGVCDDVNIGSSFIWEDRELLMRVLEVTVNCTKLKQLDYTETSGGEVSNETPAGVIDGTNKTFTFANTPNPATSLEVYLNGMYMTPDVDYTLTDDTIVFVEAPVVGSVLIVSYKFDTEASATAENETPAGDIDEVNKTFTLTNIPVPSSSLKLFLNGMYMTPEGEDYTLTSKTIVFINAPSSGSVMRAFYKY